MHHLRCFLLLSQAPLLARHDSIRLRGRFRFLSALYFGTQCLQAQSHFRFHINCL